MIKDKNKIPSKNYVYVVMISVLTLAITGYFCFWYKSYSEYNQNNSIMSGYLLEIGEQEIINNLENYVLDNPNTILYISYGNDSKIKQFEIGFKNMIEENNLKSSFIYIDLNKVPNKTFESEFREKFFSDELNNLNVEKLNQPNLLVFEAGKVKKLLYYTEKDITIEAVKKFLISEEVIVND